MMTTALRNVSEAIEAILSNEVAEIPWKTGIMGPQFPKELTGFICCDEIQYHALDKEESMVTATFAVQIICPNPKDDPQNTTAVEDYAMKVRQVLAKERKLDGWASDSYVDSITFATPAGTTSIGIAILKFVVNYEEE